MRLVAIDPGVHGAGVAVFEEGLLVSAAWVEPKSRSQRDYLSETADAIVEYLSLRGLLDARVVIEQMESRGSTWTTATNDLIRISLMTGMVLARCSDYGLVTPGTWKGQTPKVVMHRRMLSGGLSDQEVQAAALGSVPKARTHDVLDAGGIGLYALGRRP